MAMRGGGSSRDAEALAAGPNVFLSYRRRDTGDVTRLLSELLAADLGGRNVFRDEEDLIAGQPFQAVLDRSIEESDATVCVVGPHWVGDRQDGTRRIDDESDAVRQEVRVVLDKANHAVPVPVLVDIAEPPVALPDDVAPLFDHHAVRTTRDDLGEPASAGYQALLVGVWEAVRQRVPHGVLLLGEQGAMARLDQLVEELRASDQISARELSRFAAGAYVLSARRIRRGKRRWPDVIVVAEDQPSPALRARLRAIDDHPKIRNVSLVALGAGATLAAAEVVSGAGVSFASPSSFLGSLPSSSGPLSGLTSAWSTASAGAKTAVALGAVVTAGVTGVVSVALSGGDSASACSDATAGSVVLGSSPADGSAECFVFDGVSGDNVLLRIDDGDGDGLFVANMQVVRPDGSLREDCTHGGTYEAEVICELDVSGEHMVEVTQTEPARFAGDFAFTWRSLTSSSGCTAADASTTTTGIIEHESKPACFAVDLTAGQPIFVHAIEGDDTSFAGSVRVVRPDGSVRTDCTNHGTNEVDTFCGVDVSGEHLVLLSQTAINDDGPMTLWWQRVDDPGACTSAQVAVQTTVVIASRAQPACVRVSGEAGDNAVIEIGADRGVFGELWIVGPDGVPYSECRDSWSDGRSTECVLDAIEEHLVLLTMRSGGVGQQSVDLTWTR